MRQDTKTREFFETLTFEVPSMFSSKVPNAFLLFQGCNTMQHDTTLPLLAAPMLSVSFPTIFASKTSKKKIKIESALSALLSLVFAVLSRYSETRRTRSISEMGCSVRNEHMFPDRKTPVQSTWQYFVILRKKINHQFVRRCYLPVPLFSHTLLQKLAIFQVSPDSVSRPTHCSTGLGTALRTSIVSSCKATK